MSENEAAVQGDWVSRAELVKALQSKRFREDGGPEEPDLTDSERNWNEEIDWLIEEVVLPLAAPVSGQGHDELDWRDFYDRAAKIANLYHAMLEMKHGELVAALPLLQNSIDLLAAPVLGGDK